LINIFEFVKNKPQKRPCFPKQLADATAGLPAWPFGKSQLHIPLISANDLIHAKTPSRVSYLAGCQVIELAYEPHQQQTRGI